MKSVYIWHVYCNYSLVEISRSQVKAWMRERRGGEEEPNSRWNLFGLTFHKSKLLLIISLQRYLRNQNLHTKHLGVGNLYPFVEITILTHNVKPKQAMPGVHWILLKWDGVSKNNVKLAHTSFVKKKTGLESVLLQNRQRKMWLQAHVWGRFHIEN